MAPASLTVGTVQVTAVCDVTADFPAPRERAFPQVEAAAWAPAPGGVEPDEIDLVVLTHLRLDHIGWNLAWDGDRPCPRFPRPTTGSSGPTGSCSRPGATRPTGRPSTAAWPPSRPSGWPSCWTATGPRPLPRALRHRHPGGRHPPLAGPPLTRRPRP